MGALSQTIKRRVNAVMSADMLEYKIKNDSINGVKVGCYGFIRNKENGLIVYINTDVSKVVGDGKVCIRYARNFNDFTGCSSNDFVNEADIGKAVKRYLTRSN